MIFIVAVLSLLTTTYGQTTNLNCIYYEDSGLYTCLLQGLNIPDNLNQNFVIGGEHNTGRTNADVLKVLVQASNMPFVVTQLFTTFSNVQHFIARLTNILRIQPNAFANAGNLVLIDLQSSNIGQLGAQAFSGAGLVRTINLANNNLETINENPFSGLSNLEILFLTNNQIRLLPVNVFNALTSLTAINLNNNAVEIIPGRLFEHNRLLRTINLQGNGINAIGRSFLNGLTNLEFLNLQLNACVDQLWWNEIHVISREIIEAALTQCFQNSVEEPEIPVDTAPREFILEVRGSLTLRYQDETEIVRI